MHELSRGAWESEVAEAWPAGFVAGNEDNDDFEEPEERRKRGSEENMMEQTVQCAESDAKCVCVCVLRRVALERNTNIDEGNVKLIKNRQDPESSRTSIS